MTITISELSMVKRNWSSQAVSRDNVCKVVTSLVKQHRPSHRPKGDRLMSNPLRNQHQAGDEPSVDHQEMMIS